jgi:hypothetical protein
VERLCQLASSLLDRNGQQQASTSVPSPAPIPVAPIVINRMRTGNHSHFFRGRYRRRIHPRTVLSTLSPQPLPPTPILTSSTRSSSRTNLTEPSVPPPTPARDRSRESLVSLYWLFQDNINSSRTHIV